MILSKIYIIIKFLCFFIFKNATISLFHEMKNFSFRFHPRKLLFPHSGKYLSQISQRLKIAQHVIEINPCIEKFSFFEEINNPRAGREKVKKRKSKRANCLINSMTCSSQSKADRYTVY